MAYAAVISLKQTIHRLLNSSYISVVSSVREIIDLAYKEVESLQEVLERLDDGSNSRSRTSERVQALDGEIREAVWVLEDVIESHVSNLLLSHNYDESSGDPFLFSVDLQEDVDSFIRKAKKMEEDYIKELSNPLSEEDRDYAVSVLSTTDFGGENTKMVGLTGHDDDDVTSRMDFDGQRMKIDLDSLLGWSDGLQVVSLIGMAGIGKTTLAMKIYKNTSIMGRFKHHVWVNIGPECNLREILVRILLQLDLRNSEVLLGKSEKDLGIRLHQSLYQVSYLIVLDDVWDVVLFNTLSVYFPDNRNGSRVLLTSRQVDLADYTIIYMKPCQMRLLDEEESWNFLCEKVFPNESCPRQLVEAGKKIAQKCDGLPLTIATVADILSKAEKTQEYWNKVATEKKNSVFMDAYNQMSEVLLSSYNHLLQRLQTCFLYMGVFSQDYVIPPSKLIKLWSAEAFLEPGVESSLVENFIVECLEALLKRSLVIKRQRSSKYRTIKTCNLHAAYWHLSNIEAGNNKTFHVLDCYDDISIEGIKSQRRLSVRNSVLFNIKDVYGSMTSILSLRSILCTGEYYQYPVQICSSWKLLRVLDALAIRFYQFPIEVLKLVHLMYLAITYHGKLPALIANLRNLQSLIVHRHRDIKFSKDPLYLPVEIWGMKELKHIQVTGSDLPDPPCDAVLPNLLTLLDVSAESCTRRVFGSIPKLKKLGIRIELTPDSVVVPLHFFDHISYLQELESLKCVIMNPILKSEVAAPPASLPIILPSSLKKLSLSGCGFPWKYMNKILLLPKLEVLKLRSYDFCGPFWEMPEEDDSTFWKMQKEDIVKLRVLILEDVDLVEWMCNSYNFPYLERLIIRHCYKLKGIPSDIGEIRRLELIELVDCSRDAVYSGEVIRKEQEQNLYLQVRISSSCE